MSSCLLIYFWQHTSIWVWLVWHSVQCPSMHIIGVQPKCIQWLITYNVHDSITKEDGSGGHLLVADFMKPSFNRPNNTLISNYITSLHVYTSDKTETCPLSYKFLVKCVSATNKAKRNSLWISISTVYLWNYNLYKGHDILVIRNTSKLNKKLSYLQLIWYKLQ